MSRWDWTQGPELNAGSAECNQAALHAPLRLPSPPMTTGAQPAPLSAAQPPPVPAAKPSLPRTHSPPEPLTQRDLLPGKRS